MAVYTLHHGAIMTLHHGFALGQMTWFSKEKVLFVRTLQRLRGGMGSAGSDKKSVFCWQNAAKSTATLSKWHADWFLMVPCFQA